MAKEVAVIDIGDLAEFDTDQYAGAGNENMGANDIAVPYINILQKLSPQVDKDLPEYIDGAEPGMFFQNVNDYLWKGDKGLNVIPFAYERKCIEWVPREKGGGLVAIHPQSAVQELKVAVNDRNVPLSKDGNLLVDTATHYVLYESPDGKWEPAIISMKSSNHTKNRVWNSLIAQQVLPSGNPAPRWLHVWNLKTVLEQKDDNRWYNFEIGRLGMVSKEQFLQAADLHDKFASGFIKPVIEGEEEVPF